MVDDIELRCVGIAKEIQSMRDVYETAKKASTDAWHKLEDMELKLIALMDANHMPSFKVEGIGTLYRAERVYAKILDLERTIKFFEETGQAQELFKMSPVRERLNAVVKELVADGHPVPDSIEYQVTPTLHIRKS